MWFATPPRQLSAVSLPSSLVKTRPAAPRASLTSSRRQCLPVFLARMARYNFTPDEDESQPELVVFGSPRIFQAADEYDARLLDARYRRSRINEPVSPGYLWGMNQFESFLMRPNAVLTNTLASMSPNPLLSPQDPVDPATQFCSCGACPDGIAMTQECRFLTIFRREQRFRRRAATSPAIGGINRWHAACSTRPAFGRACC